MQRGFNAKTLFPLEVRDGRRKADKQDGRLDGGNKKATSTMHPMALFHKHATSVGAIRDGETL